MIAAHFEEHVQVVRQCADEVIPTADAITELLRTVLDQGGRIFVCGNGGSAADAQHFAAELVGRFERVRRSLPAMALGADPTLITALANDLGFEAIFARQVDALATAEDVLVVLSTSGESANAIAAAKAARSIGCPVVAMTGRGPNALGAVADVHLAVPSSIVARIQEVHGLVLHAIASALEADLDDDGPL